MNVMNLVAKLSLDKTNFDNGIKGAQSSASGLGKSFNGPLGNISSKFTALGTTLGTVGQKVGSFAKSFAPASAGAGALIAATGALAMKAASAGDRIDKMSQKVGLSRKSFQEMDFVMSQSGANIESLQTGMKTLTKQISSASTGTKSSAEAFKKLGVSVTESDGSLRNQEDVMWDTIKALQGMDNQTEKARLASQLFGRAGTELLPLLNQEAGSLDEMRRKANDLGLVMSDDAVDASVKFTDTMDQLKRALAAAGARIGTALIPYIQKFADYVIKNIPKIQNVIKGVADKIASLSPTVLKVIGVVMLAITAIAPVAGVIASIVTVVGGLATAIGFLLTPMGLIVVAIGAAVAAGVLIYKNWDTIKAKAIELWNNLQTSFSQIGTAIKQAWNAAKTATINTWNNIKSAVMNVVNAVRAFVNGGFNAIKTAITNAWKTVQRLTSTVWNAIKSAVSSAINSARSTVNTVVSKIKSLMSFSGLATTVSNVWNSIKSKVGEKINAARETVRTAVEKVKSFLKFSGAKDTVANIFESIKTAIKNKLEDAKTAVGNIIKAIKDKLKFKWKLPKLQLPHPKISGKFSLNPPSVPKFSLKWYRKAMDNLTVLDGASIFGAMGGNLLGGGEAGRELVIGEDKALDMIRKASGNENIEVLLLRLINLLGQWLPQKTVAYISRKDVTDTVDRELGKLFI